ncbi:4193_t:CDS:10 [Gigaspora margarita]|uniref:4193_t:CDS:1 n=1 Tax=Gigaspora margarita TaxID=4874 RepID=A0ABN7UMX9_GIGMA|nr:4193_t:CDS:10 [Gigaspora margarita]
MFGDVEDIIFPIEEGKNIDAAEGLKCLDEHIFHESKMNANSFVDKKCQLIVRNIPWEYQEPELLKIFSAHEKVVELNLLNGPLHGFAYIQYKKVNEAERAINTMNETVHHGQTIAVDWSLPKDKYLKAMKSQQDKHDYEQNNDYNIDSCDSDSYENNLMDIDESEIDSIENRSKNKNSVKHKNNILSENTVLFIHNISFEAIEKELSDMKIDYAVCNLYLFKETIAKKGITIGEAVEEIDIDISQLTLHYGTNPHQKPTQIFVKDGCLPIQRSIEFNCFFLVLSGSTGYINLLDALNGWSLVKKLKAALNLPATASFKNLSPAGAAFGLPLNDIEKRWADRMSSFGNWITLSDIVYIPIAKIISSVITTSYDAQVLEILSKKKDRKYTVIQLSNLVITDLLLPQSLSNTQSNLTNMANYHRIIR